MRNHAAAPEWNTRFQGPTVLADGENLIKRSDPCATDLREIYRLMDIYSILISSVYRYARMNRRGCSFFDSSEETFTIKF